MGDSERGVPAMPARVPPAWASVGQDLYVRLMLGVVGRGLVAISQVDETVRRELAVLPEGYTIGMRVMPKGPSFAVRVGAGGRLELDPSAAERPRLGVCFKHRAHAFLVFSFQEGTARAFANDRMYVDGDVSHAVRVVRCLDRMQAAILPDFVAARALKRLPAQSTAEKLGLGARIYLRLVLNLLRGK